MKKKKVSLFLDSGAPSLYNKFMRAGNDGSIMGSLMKDRKHDDFSFIKSKEYLDYKQEYGEYILQNKDLIDVYVNLDVINNPEETWKNQEYYEKMGLKPLPVFHLGEDVSWLKKYLEKGYDYIAIGGLIPNPFKVLAPSLDNLWSKYLTDKKGYPLLKVHGFAVTSVRLMHRYPWYSVDSTSWQKFAVYGVVIIPKLNARRQRDFTQTPIGVSFSRKSKERFEINGKHYDTFSLVEKQYFKDYLSEYGVKIGKSGIKKVNPGYILNSCEYWVDSSKKESVEVVEEYGVSNCHDARRKMNMIFFLEFQKRLPEYPWPYKSKKSFLGV